MRIHVPKTKDVCLCLSACRLCLMMHVEIHTFISGYHVGNVNYMALSVVVQNTMFQVDCLGDLAATVQETVPSSCVHSNLTLFG